MDDELLLHLKQKFACPLANQVHRGRKKKNLAAHDDSEGLQCMLFPRLRWEKDASQPSGCQEVFFVATNMLVLVYL